MNCMGLSRMFQNSHSRHIMCRTQQYTISDKFSDNNNGYYLFSRRGTKVLGYSEAKLRLRSGYEFIHSADMMHCADAHTKRKNENI